jgi:hypothetical protein
MKEETGSVSRRRFIHTAAQAGALAAAPAIVPSSVLGQRAGAVLAAGSAQPRLDHDAVAARITSALKLREGERVLMRADPGSFAELVEPLRLRIRAAKAVDRPPVSTETPLSDRMLDSADVLILLPLGKSARPFSPAEQLALVRWLNKGGARRQLHFHWADGSRHSDGLPGEHPPHFDQLYFDALDIDYEQLSAAQDRAIKLLRLGTVRIQTPAGTDVMFRTGQRPFNKQNGDASGERARQARVRIDREIELPAGVLRIAPIEETANGSIVLPEARFGDATAKKVVLQIDNGRITRVRAEQGLEAVEAALAAGGEAAYRFREFGLGFNPKLTPQPGSTSIPYYGYGAGVVRLGLGDNEELGGNVRGEFVRWLFFPDANVHVDFRYLVRKGRLVIDEE